MSRPVDLDRHQAETIIDLIEMYAEDDQEMMWLAAELREQWGCGPYVGGGRGASEGLA